MACTAGDGQRVFPRFLIGSSHVEAPCCNRNRGHRNAPSWSSRALDRLLCMCENLDSAFYGGWGGCALVWKPRGALLEGRVSLVPEQPRTSRLSPSWHCRNATAAVSPGSGLVSLTGNRAFSVLAFPLPSDGVDHQPRTRPMGCKRRSGSATMWRRSRRTSSAVNRRGAWHASPETGHC